jgi:GT2 family glycosyltransferase
MSKLSVLVSVINWNNNSATNACLASIATIPVDLQPDVYLIDNDSEKEELSIDENILKSLQAIRIIRNVENKGFAGGHNGAIRYAIDNKFDYVCLLNNDTEIVDKDIFDKLSKAIDQHQNSIAAAPTILHTLNPPTTWYGGGFMDVKRARAHHENVDELLETVSSKDTTETDFLTGCCLMISLNSGIDNLLLSEDYFLYWEDADWCARMLQNGKKLLYVPQAKILHNTSSSLGVRSPSYSYYNLRNRLLFAKRWSSVARVVPSTALTAVKIFILSFKKPQTAPKTFWYILRAFWDGLTNKTGPLS